MIIVTGGAGFVGSNLIKLLNEKGHKDILLVDSFSKSGVWKNILDTEIYDTLNYKKGIEYLEAKVEKIEKVEVVFHIGANADVLVDDADIMLEDNYEHSKFWFEFSKERNIPFIYASSSAVYGNSESFSVSKKDEKPHNEYAFSKLLFDAYVRKRLLRCENLVVGYRFFNIFGPGEFHKGKNASLPYRFFDFIVNKGYIDLFEDEIKRDYVYVEDVCRILYDTWQREDIGSGIYNLGSGNAISHRELANLVVESVKEFCPTLKIENGKEIVFIEMPQKLKKKFQFLTIAERLPVWVAERTTDNENKIREYIEYLCRWKSGA